MTGDTVGTSVATNTGDIVGGSGVIILLTTLYLEGGRVVATRKNKMLFSTTIILTKLISQVNLQGWECAVEYLNT